jgi:hypothetical protein
MAPGISKVDAEMRCPSCGSRVDLCDRWDCLIYPQTRTQKGLDFDLMVSLTRNVDPNGATTIRVIKNRGGDEVFTNLYPITDLGYGFRPVPGFGWLDEDGFRARIANTDS